MQELGQAWPRAGLGGQRGREQWRERGRVLFRWAAAPSGRAQTCWLRGQFWAAREVLHEEPTLSLRARGPSCPCEPRCSALGGFQPPRSGRLHPQPFQRGFSAARGFTLCLGERLASHGRAEKAPPYSQPRFPLESRENRPSPSSREPPSNSPSSAFSGLNSPSSSSCPCPPRSQFCFSSLNYCASLLMCCAPAGPGAHVHVRPRQR